jgi:hypothetical protein
LVGAGAVRAILRGQLGPLRLPRQRVHDAHHRRARGVSGRSGAGRPAGCGAGGSVKAAPHPWHGSLTRGVRHGSETRATERDTQESRSAGRRPRGPSLLGLKFAKITPSLPTMNGDRGPTPVAHGVAPHGDSPIRSESWEPHRILGRVRVSDG